MRSLLIVTLLLLAHADSSSRNTPIDSLIFSGIIEAGQTLEHAFGDSLVFQLAPISAGWEIVVRDLRRPTENQARLTPPLHFVPNPRDIEGWHFRNEPNTGPNDGSVNAPQEVCEFVFSPKVGISIESPLTQQSFEQIREDGQGILTITNLDLDNLIPGERASIKSLPSERRRVL